MKTLDLICAMLFAYFYVWSGLAAVVWSIYHIWDFFGKDTGNGTDNSIDSDCILYRHVYKWDSQLFGLFLYRCGGKIRQTKVWGDGYTAGYTDGINGKESRYGNSVM